MRRTSNQEGALQDLGIPGTDIVLDGVDKKMFSAFEELDISQRFIWPTRELNTNLPKAIRKDEKQRRRASNRKILSRKRRAEEAAVPSTLAGVHLLANVSVQPLKLPQDKALHDKPTRTTRSVPVQLRVASDDPFVGRLVRRLNGRPSPTLIRDGLVCDARDGKHEILWKGSGEKQWVNLADALARRELSFRFHGCRCHGVKDGLSESDLVRRVDDHSKSTSALLVRSWPHLDSLLISGVRMVPRYLVDELRQEVLGCLDFSIVKDAGAYGGDSGVLFRETSHPSPARLRFGVCYQSGVAPNGEAMARLASYSVVYGAEAWNSIRHVTPCLGELGRLARRTLAPYLSAETMAHPGFNLFDVRIYNGDVEAKTGLHTDSRPSLDADGNSTQEIMQEPGTDVVIFSIDATMLMWLRKYHTEYAAAGKEYGWLDDPVVLEHGTFFIWRCGGSGGAPGLDCDDWYYKHSVWWPRKHDEGYEGPAKGRRRIAIVMRVTKALHWFQVAPPHRQGVSV